MLLAWSLTLVLSQTPGHVSLVFGGDVIPHDPVKFVAQVHDRRDQRGATLNNAGWDHVFGPLATVFKRHDFAVVNLETPVVTLSHPETGEKVFSAPPTLLDGLKRAGVTIATFANNHCLDQHLEGIGSTREFLRQVGLGSAGADLTEDAAWTPLIVERHGVRLGVLAFTRWLNGGNNQKDPARPHVPVVAYPSMPIVGSHSVEQVAAQVRELAQTVDAVLVLVHWGNEYQLTPSPDDRALAQALVEAGALAVIGTHPHVLQPVEWLTRADGTRGLVAFSLGNLVSNQDFDDAAGRKRDSVLLELALEKQPPHGARITSVHGVPVATENRLGQGRARNVQPVLLEDELTAIDERLEALVGHDEAAARAEYDALTRKRALGVQRLERIRAVLGPAASDGGSP
jgi:poly-gamma-glutamate synthesis protein (capsule biosynthesis protein)